MMMDDVMLDKIKSLVMEARSFAGAIGGSRSMDLDNLKQTALLLTN